MVMTKKMLLFLMLMTTLVSVHTEVDVYKWGKVVRDEFCMDETFNTQCSQNEVITIQSATYGHMSLGRCVEFDTQNLGCQADVTQIVINKCNGKQTCSINISDDEEIRNTRPCRKGLFLFMVATYMCTKALPKSTLCSPVQALSTIQYITSSQITSINCKKSSDVYSYELQTRASSGQKLEISLINLDLVIPDARSSNGELGYILETESDRVVPIQSGSQVESVIKLTETNSVSVYLSAQDNRNFLLGFRAVGCADLQLQLDATVQRVGDQATVVCSTSPQRWHLTCTSGHWLGVIGNCTGATMNEGLKAVIVEEWNMLLPKEMIIMIIVCATIFLAVVVVTTGCVCLKWPRSYTNISAVASSTFDTMRSTKALPSSANQSTGTFKYIPESSRLLAIDTEQPIWEQSLPKPPINEQSSMRGNIKRNNDDVYNMSLSSNSTDYERKKYFVLDRDYMNTNTLVVNA